jgi:diadenosine tetraphosphate (Ap4A) HIT family hydrolase
MRAFEAERATRVTCEMCEAANRIEAGENTFAIARLTTGYVTLCATQYFRGYTFFAARRCVPEIYDLPLDERATHLHEMVEVAQALDHAFDPRKLNYEALGNGTPHLHWHLIPRYETDPHPRGPVWEDLNFLRQFWLGGGPPDEQSEESRRAILTQLRLADVEIEREYVGL